MAMGYAYHWENKYFTRKTFKYLTGFTIQQGVGLSCAVHLAHPESRICSQNLTKITKYFTRKALSTLDFSNFTVFTTQQGVAVWASRVRYIWHTRNREFGYPATGNTVKGYVLQADFQIKSALTL